MDDEERRPGDARPPRPLRVAALVKQVPVVEALALGPDGRLRREGTPLEMNPYCRRAVSKATELATISDGSCTVFTLGPPSADDVLREAVAWGADGAVHLSDPAFAGSDTLATARALAAAVRREGPFDLVLVGRNSTDGDTGQVGPELAQLLDLPFAAGARRMAFTAEALVLDLEQDDGFETVEVDLPAVVSVAERLTEPCKVDPEGRRAVPGGRIRRLSATDLGTGPWGDAASPTKVGTVRAFPYRRVARVLGGDLDDQVLQAVRLLEDRGALDGHEPAEGSRQLDQETKPSRPSALAEPVVARSPAAVPDRVGAVVTGDGSVPDPDPPALVVVAEPDRTRVTAELLAAGAQLAAEVGGQLTTLVVATDPTSSDDELAAELGASGADEVLRIVIDPGPGAATGAGGASPGELPGDAGSRLAAEDAASALTAWARTRRPWLVLAPSTAFGREVAARTAAALDAGMIGDAIGIDIVDGKLVAAKPAFRGAMVADITCTSPVQLVTVRPGAMSSPPPRRRTARVVSVVAHPRGRVRSRVVRRDDDVEVLARADVVIGVGTGVPPDEYSQLGELATILGAELAATRKVTDRGWFPRSRQVGVTGRSISPRLYVAVGLSGKFNHMVGVRGSGTVLAVNPDPSAPVFEHADLGIVGDWHEVVPLLIAELRERARHRSGGAGSSDLRRC